MVYLFLISLSKSSDRYSTSELSSCSPLSSSGINLSAVLEHAIFSFMHFCKCYLICERSKMFPKRYDLHDKYECVDHIQVVFH
uniref:CSON000921 protein n=1 Tax=Culicoides sonorensis TaxID=179676 RepID=A0A336M2P1_CULSO